jgi:hypothetical protein
MVVWVEILLRYCIYLPLLPAEKRPKIYQCWVVLRMMNKYWLVINLVIYSLTYWFSKYSKNQFWHINHDFQKCKMSKNWPKNCRFFCEKCWFFEMFEITRIRPCGSLILQFFKNKFKEPELEVLWFQNIWRSEIGNSLKLQRTAPHWKARL